MSKETVSDEILGLYLSLTNIQDLIIIEKDKRTCNMLPLSERLHMWNRSTAFIKEYFPKINIIFERDLVEDKIVNAIISVNDDKCTIDDFIIELEKKYPNLKTGEDEYGKHL